MRATALFASFASFVPVALFAGIVALTAGACSNQGEGDVCDLDNGNNDCESPLTCQHAPGVAPSSANVYRCCPVDVATATAPACQAPFGGLDGSSEVPDGAENASLPDATVSEAGPDAAPEAAAEASVDAAVPGADAGGDATPEASSDSSSDASSDAPRGDAADGAPE